MKPVTFTEQEVLAAIGRLYMTNTKLVEEADNLQAANDAFIDLINKVQEESRDASEEDEQPQKDCPSPQ